MTSAARPTISIASTFTAEPVESTVLFWLDQLGLSAFLRFAPYGQVYQTLLDPAGLFGGSDRGLNVVFVRFEDWRRAAAGERRFAGSWPDAAVTLDREVKALIDALSTAARQSSREIFVCVCPPSARSLRDAETAALLRRAETALVGAFADNPRVAVLSSAALLAMYAIEDYDDPHGDELGHVPYTASLFAALGTAVARRFHAVTAAGRRKVIAVDCDDTLWQGVCGEVGPSGIVVDPPRLALQQFLVRQQEAGMLLCLCSKNNPEDVHAVFDAHAEMPLQRRHLIAERLNWEPKSSNLQSIARELQLGLDSFVFLDDNPIECAEVRSACPELVTLRLPQPVDRIPDFLAHAWVFDRVQPGTAEDRQRTTMYRENVQRESLRRQSATLADFLAGLELQVRIAPPDRSQLQRVAQLTERTNQFNVTTIRRSESEIASLCSDGSLECRVVEVSDRFGDYGLVGVLLFRQSATALDVDTFLLSCRVLGRGVEHRMLAELGVLAEARGLQDVDIRVVTTSKNRPALDFLERVCAEHRRPNEALHYRFPASFASTAGERVLAAPVAPAEQTAAVDAATEARVIAPSEVLQRIATDLRDADRILDAVNVWRLDRAVDSPRDASSTIELPATDVEETIARVWRTLLARPAIGRHDNFFDIGGDSLLATQAVSRLRQHFDVRLPLRSVFDMPTVAALAAWIERQRVAQAAAAPALGPIARDRELRLSFAQQRLWFMEQLEPGVAYNPATGLRLTGALDVAILERALNEIVARHESLRTTFESRDGRPVQVIAPNRRQRVELKDFTGLPVDRREHEAFRQAGVDAQQPFDLGTGPLLRTVLFRIDGRDHLLLIAMHHIVCDAWSLAVAAREVSELYGAFSRGLPSPLPSLPVQFADYAAWQREWLHGAVLDQQLAYWQTQVADLPKLLEIPADRPRPPAQTHRGGHHRFALSPELTARLKDLSQRHGATLFMTLLAAFEVVLARHTGQDRFIVSTAVANRAQRETERLIGCLINVLLLRADVSGDPTFADLVARVRDVALGAQAHQDAPFEQLVDRLQPERDLRYNPLAQVMFVLLNSGMESHDLGDLRIRQVDIDSAATAYDVVVHMREDAGRLSGFVHYSADIFEPETVARVISHFARLLEGAAGDPSARVSTLPLLSNEERQTILVEWNRTERAFDHERPVHALVAEQARRTPDAVAVEFEGRRLLYRELDTRSNQLARHLRAHGAGPDTLVALAIDRSLEMIVGMLGIVKSGAAYVPLDPAFPKSRLEYMLADADVRVLITENRLRGELPTAPVTLALDSDWPRVAEESDGPLEPSATAVDLAYVIYTSGSTGVPKGVEIPHRALVNFLQSIRVQPGLASGDRLVAVTTLSFDIAGLEIWLPLITGATVVVASREVASDGIRLRELLADSRATVLQATPSTWRLLLDAGWDGGQDFKALCGGEALPPSLAETLAARAGSLWNMYGPTETTIWSTIHRVEPGSAYVSLGRPIANTSVYVVDKFDQPVPINAAGELLIGGAGLARGYRNRPDLTADKFIADRFSRDPAARLYRTGDLVRYRANGLLEYLGRLDYQVKIRGHRIELGDIEAALDAQPSVRQSVVVAREDEGEKRLVGYVVPNEGAPVNISELRRALRDRLPEHMVPSVFVALDEMPLTANGKVDRKALPAPDAARPDVEAAFVAPRTAEEELLAGIWSQLLGVDRVGVHDNFFDLGGHSIAATQVVSRVRSTFGLELPLRAVFEQPTVGGLAERLARLRTAGTVVETPALLPVARSGELPLSFAQQRLWFIDQLEPGNSSYNLPGAFWLNGPLDVEALERSVATIVSRHETLRTRFPSVDGRPVQVIASAAASALAVIDLSGRPEAEREEEARRRANAEAQRPFDLAAGPLLRTTLVRLAPERHLFLVTMHHIVSDGWSLEVFAEELRALYGSFTAGEASPLAPLPVQYVDFAAWQRTRLQGEHLDAELAYWKRQLAGVPTLLTLPADHPRPAVQTFRGRERRFVLPTELSDRVKEIGRREGTTLFMTLMAALQVLFNRYSGQEQFIVSTGIANRGTPETERLIGCLINVLLLKGDFSLNPTFRDVLRHVREDALGAYAHQELPFDKLVEELQPDRDLSYNPLTQVMFVLLRGPMDRLDLPGLEVTPLVLESVSSQYDLVVHMWETTDGLSGFCHYSSDLFDPATIDRLLGNFEVLLDAAIKAPDEPVDTLPLVAPAERQQMLFDWNATERPFPDGACLHDLFELQAARSPASTAVIHGDTTLSYGELDARANQLAHYLRRRGVGPDVPVGLCVERSIELVIGILGILKAGGAYVPLDPAYPEDRLRMMLDDSKTSVLLTQEHLRAALPATDGEVISIDASWGEVASEPTDKPASGVTCRNLSYVIYTSGSTGAPKGIALEHRGVVNNLVDLNWRHDVGPADRVLALSSLSFDMCVYEVLGTLEAGGAIVMPLPSQWREPAAWAELVRRHHVSVWNSAPQLLKMFVDHVADRPDVWPVDLHVAILGGDWVPVSLPDRLKAMAPKVRVIVLGGATEASIHSTIYEVERTDPSWKSIPYGRPMYNQKTYILNPSLQPQPIGVAGELYLGGIGLGRGYFNRPEQTAERFLKNPFVPGERIYRTGDLARYCDDGNIELIGRVDYQVKLRGLRIECGEIEATLRRHSAVREAVVVAKQSDAGDKRLFAYVRPHDPDRVDGPDSDALATDLRDFVRSKLPDYMVPSGFICLRELPLSPNGKVDRKALTLLAAPASQSEAAFVAPEGDTERAIARIFADVVGAELVGAHANFFDLGGHSLLAAQVVAQIRKTFDIELPLRSIFEAPTVAALAVLVDTRMQEGRGRRVPPIVPIQRTASLPLSFAQEGLWFIQELVPESAAYNIAPGVRLRGRIDPDALEHAVATMIARHEVLRTTFVEHDGHPVQVIAPHVPGQLGRDDLRQLPRDQREAAALALADREARIPFDLSSGPLVRVRLITIDDDDHLLTLTFHHAVVDGWSLDVVTRELEAAYRAYVDRGTAELPALPVQFADFAAFERSWLSDGVLDELTAFWTAALEGAPVRLELPSDRVRPPAQTLHGARHFFVLGLKIAERVDALARDEQASPFMTMLSAFQIFLTAAAAVDEVLVGVPFANRVHRETHGLIGPFVNTLPVRARVVPDATFRSVVRQARGAVLAAEAHQWLPFDRIVEALKPPRDLSRNPIFQANFRMLAAPPFALELPGVQSELRISDAVTSKFDLALELCPAPEGLRGFFEYSTDLFDPATVHRMARQFERLVVSLLDQPDARLADLKAVGDIAAPRTKAERAAASSPETAIRGIRRKGVSVAN